jgi:prolyl-tRNA synthetase
MLQHARWTKSLIPTLKETPQEAQIKSHRLMLRSGLARKLASGTYTYLPLGLRSLKKAEAIIREEMNSTGAHELLFPALHPAELWKETGRYEIMGEGMFRIKDRHGKENVLGPTHEEVVTDLARREIHSYKQLPINLYQIQTKFRDEARPRSGVIRSREFVMKDAYSFHPDDACLDRMYNLMRETYKKIFTRCGLEFFIVQADPGDMGGSGSQEFVLFSDAGEDRMVRSGDSDTVMSVEMAWRKLKDIMFGTSGFCKLQKIHTPGHSSIESLCKFLNKEAKDFVKTIVFEYHDHANQNGLLAVLVRGDHEVSEYKVKKTLELAGSKNLQLALASRDLIDRIGSSFGFTGPVGFKARFPIFIDEDVLQMKDFIIGANEKDHHYKDVNFSDIESDINIGKGYRPGDFRQVVEGDISPDGQKLQFKTAIELGHIFKLNLRYSKPMKANVLDASGKEIPMVMGCYGIGVNRILASAIEQSGDEKGIIWPKNIAPYQVQIILMDTKDAQSQEIVSSILNSKELAAAGVDVLIDDRDDSAGIKFNDADLLGIPLRVILGPKNLKNGKVELKVRRTGQITLTDIPNVIQEILSQLDKIT